MKKCINKVRSWSQTQTVLQEMSQLVGLRLYLFRKALFWHPILIGFLRTTNTQHLNMSETFYSKPSVTKVSVRFINFKNNLTYDNILYTLIQATKNVWVTSALIYHVIYSIMWNSLLIETNWSKPEAKNWPEN